MNAFRAEIEPLDRVTHRPADVRKPSAEEPAHELHAAHGDALQHRYHVARPGFLDLF